MSDIHSEQGEPAGITAGTRVWVGPVLVSHLDGQSTGNPSGAFVHTDASASVVRYGFDSMLPDHRALPGVAAELARQGDGAVAVVMPLNHAEVIEAAMHTLYPDWEGTLSVTRQLDGQRGGGE